MTDITVRPLSINVDDFQAFAHIMATVYQIDEKIALETLKDNPRYNSLHVIVAEIGSNIVGTAIMFPAKIWLSGVPLDIGAISNVAVLPDYRNMGVGSSLMETLISRAKDEEYALAVTFPFSHSYFQRFGFGEISDIHAYQIDPANLMTFEERNIVRDFDAGDLPMMRVMYKGQMTWHNGWFSRSNEWWDSLIQQWPKIVVADNDDMIDGYLALGEKVDAQGRKVLVIHELFAAEGMAARALIGYLAEQTDYAYIEYLAPADTLFRYSMKQPHSVDATHRGQHFYDLCHMVAGPMARIINLRQALTKRFYARHMQGERIIKLTDPSIARNQTPMIFRLVDGRAESRPASDSNEVQVETDIRTFTQILCGYLPAIDAQRLGRLKADEDTCSWFDKALADSPIHIQSGDWF